MSLLIRSKRTAGRDARAASGPKQVWRRRGLAAVLALVGLAALGAKAPSETETTVWRSSRGGSADSLAEGRELSLLTLNVSGIPGWVSRDDPKSRMAAIGRLANAYDVALFQEDFLYHDELAAALDHAFLARGGGARSRLFSLVPFLCGSCGSGLSVAARIAPDDLLELTRRPFGGCVGWFEAKNDCWTNKGIMALRLKLSEQAELDLYTLHMEAGRGDADRAVRLSQLENLARTVEAYSRGRAVILAGDFNLNWFRTADRALLEAFTTRLGLRDSRAWPESGGPSWRVDYILYRAGPGLALDLLEAGPADRSGSTGARLSNHPALAARFRIALEGT